MTPRPVDRASACRTGARWQSSAPAWVCARWGGLCTLPADAALPGQRAAWRGRGGLVGVVELRTLEVQNDLGHTTTTQGQYARLCAHVDTRDTEHGAQPERLPAH